MTAAATTPEACVPAGFWDGGCPPTLVALFPGPTPFGRRIGSRASAGIGNAGITGLALGILNLVNKHRL